MRIKTAVPLTLSMIAKSLKAVNNSDKKINAITTHSAMCEKDDLFIALPGEKVDGAIFIEEARKKGAFILSTSEKADFKVNCPYTALLDIASYYKETINPKYTVAVTGSVGKTTVKDFIHTLLSSNFKTHKTSGNYNNILGLSYTLLSMPESTEALVAEIGMNHKGEIDVLSRAIKPDISVITNIGTAHIGNLGSKKAIAEAKLEIQSGMNGGKTIIFKEESLLSSARNAYLLSYSDKNADLFAAIISRTSESSKIYVKTKSFEMIFESELYSKHTIDSLLIGIGVCDIIGIKPEKIYEGIQNITANTLRQKFINKNGYRIYDDSYNSSPEAVIADLNMLTELGNENSALIGDMLELGENSREYHRQIGEECANHFLKKLYTFGKYAEDIACGAIDAGMKSECVFINTNLSAPEITASQTAKSYNGETLLIKASHSVRADRITEILTQERRS